MNISIINQNQDKKYMFNSQQKKFFTLASEFAGTGKCTYQETS